MKVYNKSELRYKNGRLITKDNYEFAVDSDIINSLNYIERQLQEVRHKAMYANTPTPIYKEFKQVSEHSFETAKIEIKTPELDKQAKLGEKLYNEIANKCNAEEANKSIDSLPLALLQFINEDEVFASDTYGSHVFDLKLIGNPLELTMQRLVDIICEISGVK